MKPWKKSRLAYVLALTSLAQRRQSFLSGSNPPAPRNGTAVGAQRDSNVHRMQDLRDERAAVPERLPASPSLPPSSSHHRHGSGSQDGER